MAFAPPPFLGGSLPERSAISIAEDPLSFIHSHLDLRWRHLSGGRCSRFVRPCHFQPIFGMNSTPSITTKLPLDLSEKLPSRGLKSFHCLSLYEFPLKANSNLVLLPAVIRPKHKRLRKFLTARVLEPSKLSIVLSRILACANLQPANQNYGGIQPQTLPGSTTSSHPPS